MDGSYLVPDDFDGILSCISPGVSTYKRFEDELLDGYGICSYLVDYSVDKHEIETPFKEGKQFFKKLRLDLKDSAKSVTLQGLVDESDVGHGIGDKILQMDIEGGEWKVLDDAKEELLLRFRIIVIEFHGLREILLSKESLEARVLEKLRRTHAVVHLHPNNYSIAYREDTTGRNLPNVMEVTYLRNDRFSLTPSCPRANAHSFLDFPHPLDVQNTLDKEPLHLNKAWSMGYRSVNAQLIIERDWRKYYSKAALNGLRAIPLAARKYLKMLSIKLKILGVNYQ